MPNLDIPSHPPLQKGTSPTPKSIERITGIPEVSRGRKQLTGGVQHIHHSRDAERSLAISLSLPALLQSFCIESLQLLRQAAPIF